MSKITLKTASGVYPVLIEKGIISQLGLLLEQYCRGRTVFVVTDEQVGSLYLDPVRQNLAASGFDVHYAVMPVGEKTKSLAKLSFLHERMHEAGITRLDPVVALGGGVIGDLTGFAAATWLRGVPLVQVPTSLLAQVDSSVGGKTGIDTPYGKNLVGSFYQPTIVVIDPALLDTLPKANLAEGMAEVIKCGLIGDLLLLDGVRRHELELSQLIERSVALKAAIVMRDEKDTGERMLLNFGHTFGHAIEKVSNFSRFSHGQAVAAGMVIAANWGEDQGLTSPGTGRLIAQILADYGLPTRVDLPLAEIEQAIFSDKKRLGQTIHLVVLREPGKAFVYPVSRQKLNAGLARVWQNG